MIDFGSGCFESQRSWFWIVWLNQNESFFFLYFHWSLYLHSISILSSTWNHLGYSLHSCHWYVEFWLYSCWIIYGLIENIFKYFRFDFVNWIWRLSDISWWKWTRTIVNDYGSDRFTSKSCSWTRKSKEIIFWFDSLIFIIILSIEKRIISFHFEKIQKEFLEQQQQKHWRNVVQLVDH